MNGRNDKRDTTTLSLGSIYIFHFFYFTSFSSVEKALRKKSVLVVCVKPNFFYLQNFDEEKKVLNKTEIWPL